MNKRQLKKQRKFQTVEVGDKVKIVKCLFGGHPAGTIGLVYQVDYHRPDFSRIWISRKDNPKITRCHHKEEIKVIEKGAKRK